MRNCRNDLQPEVGSSLPCRSQIGKRPGKSAPLAYAPLLPGVPVCHREGLYGFPVHFEGQQLAYIHPLPGQGVRNACDSCQRVHRALGIVAHSHLIHAESPRLACFPHCYADCLGRGDKVLVA